MFPIYRTPEEGHTAPCLTHALVCALENLRDCTIEGVDPNGSAAQYAFRLLVQDNVPLMEADTYLAEGVVACMCPR